MTAVSATVYSEEGSLVFGHRAGCLPRLVGMAYLHSGTRTRNTASSSSSAPARCCIESTFFLQLSLRPRGVTVYKETAYKVTCLDYVHGECDRVQTSSDANLGNSSGASQVLPCLSEHLHVEQTQHLCVCGIGCLCRSTCLSVAFILCRLP